MPAKPEARRVAFDGALTIRHIRAIRDRLMEALSGSQTVRVDCVAATEVDLSFIQLMLSARRSAMAAGKTILLSAGESSVLHDALVRAGMLPVAACEPTPDQTFWLNKEAVDGKDHPHRG